MSRLISNVTSSISSQRANCKLESIALQNKYPVEVSHIMESKFGSTFFKTLSDQEVV